MPPSRPILVFAPSTGPDDGSFGFREHPVAPPHPRNGRGQDRRELLLPPASVDAVALVVELRSGSGGTLLCYDYVSGREGDDASDRRTGRRKRVWRAVDLGRLFQEPGEVCLEVERHRGWDPVDRVGGPDPLARTEGAFVIPVAPGRSTRIRLTEATPSG